MHLLILDPADSWPIIERRQRLGIDRRDEVWEGVYLLMPVSDNVHQEILSNLTVIFGIVIQQPGLGKVRPGVNISDRTEGWEQNYRCPDVVVFRGDTQARNCDAFWFGGPDFAVEVVSPYDRTREKLGFYSKVGTRELLVVDRDPWALEFYRLDESGTLVLVGTSTLDQPATLTSGALPFAFRLEPGAERPIIRVAHTDGIQVWSA